MNSNSSKMPKPAQMPLPPGVGHNSFLTPMHEDVGRVMQNIIDLQAEVSALRKSNQEWERRALLAEGKVEQARQEIIDLKDDFNRELDSIKSRHLDEMERVIRELDYFKNRDAVVQTKLNIGAQHFLDCIAAIDKDRKEHQVKALSNIESEMARVLDDANKDEAS